MEDAYFLLRNNQEKGPFNLKELIALSLLPNDLVWIVGKSTSWYFPFEVDALKPHLKTADNHTEKNHHTFLQNESSKANEVVNKTFVYVQVPRQTASNNEYIAHEKEEELTADALQKKADEIYQRVMVFAKQKQQAETEVSPSLPFQHLKDDYEKKQQQKTKKKEINYKKRWVMTATVTGIAATGIFISMYSTPIKTKPLLQLKNYRTNAVIAAKKETINKPVFATNFTAQKPASQITYTPSESTVDAFIDSVEKAMARHNRYTSTVSSKKYTNNTKPKKLDNKQVLVTPKFTTELIPTESKITVPLSQFIVVTAKPVYKNKNTLQGVDVAVQNNNPAPVRLATVRLTYYKKNGEIAEEQTLLFQNINTKNASAITAISNKKAARATAKLVQVQ